MPASKICQISKTPFLVHDDELEFYKKMDIPEPQICPQERKRNRLAWATLRTLHRRTCDATGKQILSMYAPDAKHPVYHSEYWWSDKWDALEYGRDFDFNRPFFEQFDELFQKVPALHQSVIQSENCEYINMAGNCKNCYLSFFLDYCEDCLYVQNANYDRSCVDCLSVNESELCYECIDCNRCYDLRYSQRCIGCVSSYFLTDCRSCEYCIGCFNLVNKKYHIFNKPVSPEEFESFKKALNSRNKIEELKDYVSKASLQHPKRYYFGHSNEDFTGDDISNLKNSYDCFHCHELENVRYADYFFKTSNSVDISLYGNKSEWLYNCLKTGDQCSNDICCLCCWTGCSNNAYCHLVISCRDCFGCSGLHQKQYCILNKQYSPEDYFILREKIILHMKQTGEWGKFFPIELSPFPYNESIAHVYFPLTKEEALKQGYKWRDEQAVIVNDLSAAELPETISEVSEESLKEQLICKTTGRPYKITKQELAFYRAQDIPLPELSPEARHQLRFSKRNPLVLHDRQCRECNDILNSTYPPTSSYKLLCEECYQAAVD
jgi:hypothetical protein